ncbi:hypothetical protein [Natrinema amylolyticum]|uniref:hypothetical protein n=1 Tax=Natrinema amylolyticum TaxID=2878679 RepID=UPI001CFBEEE0|nr:hypothetical protein [Natrinema amylolyticum]
MVYHEVQTTHNEDYDGTLTLGELPDGELSFDGGAAIVEDEGVATRLADRYVNLEYAGPVEGQGAESTETEPTDLPVDPTEYTIAELETELEDQEFSEDELQAVLEAEASGQDRDGATDAIEEHLEN